ncbi:hypothetical protein [Epibacterium ulvae]|uniref:hypothetical protein n=1 Tax=Epibacterium ulvae TaxID=1156985 RepID=UPI0024902DE3|nr:hypothetical protein [Epibacterium ulvae]
MMRWALLCLTLILCAGCGRSLTESERAFLHQIHGDALNTNRVRLINGAPVAAVTFKRKARPRVTCRERILPPITEKIVTASPAAVALFNHIFFAKDWYSEDYTPLFPGQIDLVNAMLLAHEATHVWQWQNRDITGYHPLRAAAEHTRSDDPYLFDLKNTAQFLDYGFEQQGTIVEEYVCCRALAPQAARTKRLQDLLSAVMPVSALPKAREYDVLLPWRGAELSSVCA